MKPRILLTLWLSSVVVCAGGGPGATQTPRVPSVRVTRLPNGGIQPQVVRDPSGNLHLLYYTGDPAHGDLMYSESKDDGVDWSPPIRVNGVQGDAIAIGSIRGGQIAVGRRGAVYVLWLASKFLPSANADGMGLLFSRLKTDGSGFEPERDLRGQTRNLDGGASITADDSGHVWVVWHANDSNGKTEADRMVWVAASADDGAVFAPPHPAWDRKTGACGCCSLKAYASEGKLFIMYRSATNETNRDPYLLTSSDGGTTFTGTKISDWLINACPMSSFSLATSQGKWLAAWERRGVIQWEREGDSSSQSVGAAAKHPSLVCNANGDTLVVWDEGTGWQKGGAVAWQLYDRSDRAIFSIAGRMDGVPTWSFPTAYTTGPGDFVVLY